MGGRRAPCMRHHGMEPYPGRRYQHMQGGGMR